jgi:hypothetical protein
MPLLVADDKKLDCQASSNLATEFNEKRWKICSDETMNANRKKQPHY